MADTGSVIKIRADASQVVSEFGKLRAATQMAYQSIDRSAESFKELAANQRQLKQAAKIASKAIAEFKPRLKSIPFGKSRKELLAFSNGLKQLRSQFFSAGQRAHAFSRNLKSVGLAVRNSGKNLQFMGRSIMIGMLPFANAIRKASNFAKALEMAEIRFVKITNLTREAGGEFDRLSASFEKLSNAFGVSRDLITDIATDFALVGMPVSQVDTLARASNELAILGSIDVGPAKDILTSTVFAMRNMATLRGETLSFNDAIKQATGQMYLFNIVNNNTAMAISDMATAIPKLVPITVQFGLTVTEAAGALAAMKASGVSAAEGTVALRTGLLRLTSLTKQADEKVEMARSTLKDFNFEAGVGIETLANFGQSLLAIRTELGDAAAFDIVKNILGIRQTAKVQLFVMDMQSAENQIQTVKQAMMDLSNAEVFGSTQINNMTDFARASREPSEEMKQAANDLLKDATKMEDVTSQFLRSLIIQMSGVENAQKDSMVELNKVLESDAFKMQQAKTAMKNALTEMGGLINTMIVDHILPLVRHWVNGFKAMPDGVKKVIVILAALVAAFGPILYMLAIMKMAFGQTMQIMAGAIGKFFSGFTAAGRAAIVAANEETVALQILSAAHKHAAAAAGQQAIQEQILQGTLTGNTALMVSTAAANEVHAASHALDAAAANKAALAHKHNALTAAIRSPFGAGGMAIGRKVAGAGRWVGAKAKVPFGTTAAAAMRRPGQFARGLAARPTAAPGWSKLGRTRAGMAGMRTRAWLAPGADRWGSIGRARQKLTPGFVGRFAAGRRAAQAMPQWARAGGVRKASTVAGAMGAGQIKHGAAMAAQKATKGIGTAVKKAGGGLKTMFSMFGKMLRPIKMIKTIFMSFNPWILGFMLLLGAMAAIWVTIRNNFTTFKEAAQPGLDAIKAAWIGIKEALGAVMRSIFQVFNRLKFGGEEGADQGTQMGKVFGAVFKGIAFALKGVALLFKLLAKIISTAMDFATPYINVILGALTAIINVVKAIVAAFKGDWAEAGEYLKRALGAVMLGIVSMVDGVFNFIINQIVRLMNAQAWALEQLGKIPGMGWADTLAGKIRDAGTAMQDFGDSALDGIRRSIEAATGIQADEMIRVGDEDVRDIGKELGGVLGKGVAEGFDDEMDYAAPGMHEAINDAAKAGREEADAFADAYASAFQKFVAEVNKQLKRQMQNAIKFIMDAFDAQTDSMRATFDAQIEAINEVIKEEQRLSKEVAYQTKRREQIRDMALRRDAYRRNRALAIYEGRIDDARSLDLKERKNKEDADKKLVDLDVKHGETLLSQQRADTIDLINEQKKAYETLREDMKTELDGVLTELTRFTPKNKEEWNLIVDQIDGEITRIVGDGESDGLMGRLKSAYHPSMGDMPTFDWGGIFDTAVADATANMREIYEWTPATMEADGPFQWLFDEFDKVETEFTAFEEMIKTWKDRLKDAFMGEAEGTQDALFMATKGLTEIPYGGGYESDMPVPINLQRMVLQRVVAEPVEQYIREYATQLGTDLGTASELDRESGWTDMQGLIDSYYASLQPVQPLRGPQRMSPGNTSTTTALPEDEKVDTVPAPKKTPRDRFGGGGGEATSAIRDRLGLDNVKEPLKARVVRMAMEAARDGIQMTVSGRGGYRDPADQIALFKQRYSRQGPGYAGGGEGDKYWDGSWWKHISGAEVGTPGRSLHERGEAVDISGPSGKRDERWAWMKTHAKRFDLWAPIAKEPWHHAREGIRNVWSLATGGLVGGLHNQSKMAMLHGGEFVMSARATRNIGMGALSAANSFSQFTGPNEAGGGVTNTSSSNVTIHVETFVGQREWFEKMMSDYNIHIAPSSERARGIEKRTVGSYTERNTRSRV